MTDKEKIEELENRIKEFQINSLQDKIAVLEKKCKSVKRNNMIMAVIVAFISFCIVGAISIFLGHRC